MDQADQADRVTCPQSGEVLKPEKRGVWNTKGPGGKPQRFGILKKHHHNRQECPWSGLPVPVVDRVGKID